MIKKMLARTSDKNFENLQENNQPARNQGMGTPWVLAQSLLTNTPRHATPTTDISSDSNPMKRPRMEDGESAHVSRPLQQIRLMRAMEPQISQQNAVHRQTFLEQRILLQKYRLESQKSMSSIDNYQGSHKKESRTSSSSIHNAQLLGSKDESIAQVTDLNVHHSRSEMQDEVVGVQNCQNEPIRIAEKHLNEANIRSENIDKDSSLKYKHIKEESSYPNNDLLFHLRTLNNETSNLTKRLDELYTTMTGSQIIDEINKNNCSNDKMHLLNVNFIPGNRIPSAPRPPPLVTSSADINSTESVLNHSRPYTLENEFNRLLPATPSVYLNSKKDAHSFELRQFCLSQPVVLIRNLVSTLRLDLGLFSTKMLVSSNATHMIEQRIQDLQPPDENKDTTGKTLLRCVSSKNVTTIQEYANYQARTFVKAVEDKRNDPNSSISTNSSSKSGDRISSTDRPDEIKMSNINSSDDRRKKRKIYFGTNCDLSDESKWFIQLHELDKLPSFLKVVGACNMLSYCGFTIMGMNSVQLYMKVPGCRTPGHQENNNCCSINMNVGPGDCEWFSVPEQYWGAMNSLCEDNEIDYLSGSWWPSLEDLKQRQIPLYRFIQRPGDLVFINSGTVHWVQSIGWCNNVAWNVAPIESRQYNLAIERYEYNKLRGYKSIVPMIHLSWQLAKNVRITDRHLFQLIRYTLMVSIVHCSLTWNLLEKAGVPLIYQPREESEPTQYCEDCESEVFSIFLIKQTKKSSKSVTYETRCLKCSLKMSLNLHSFKCMYQIKLSELVDIYDAFILHSTKE